MSASAATVTAYHWHHTTVTSALPYAALLTADACVRNLRICPGASGRDVVTAWASAAHDRGETLALLSEAEYRCLCERRN